ncbi:bifunctional phosphopantothenoylcysteine decarboxylase/phosphopantothenate--cysteine ligase CoaBC [Demequina sp. NBRC 110056]|uniref:bifunctional phosphopantothenoylcysteine decarboxylase/phosphopantothenate--cysteine ligase CoaBC n=1 Tax=Demequina sp. NBRC 110056 TaxID=1570345 RepID=UPI000A04A931|nr:bifunctional phosphopantothenoylcysteine decarboxylase/phosphopantothenate--cysteine ligase CoaBC [Demequina sp. NBRC 110056]
MRVLLGVTGGIAAYKVASVLRLLAEDGHDVRVLPTAASLNFVGRATWEALSGNPAPTETFDDVPSVQHVRLGQRADAVLVAPATADFLAQMAAGRATDLLGNALLATEAPVMVAPAMHTEMWRDPATQANVATLRERGVHVLEPAVGRLTGPDSGPGRLPDPEDIVAALYALLDGSRAANGEIATGAAAGWGDLEGVSLVVSAGGTREPIDAVRYLGNRSSGHQGFAIAEAARERGASVTVVAANVSLPLGEDVERVDVETAAELEEAVTGLAGSADAVVMAAAVADFRPAQASDVKLKKSGTDGMTLELVQTADVLAGLVAARRPGQVIVGFAAETGDDAASVLEHGAAKARRKGADLLVLNEVGDGKGFGTATNTVTLLSADGTVVGEASGTKLSVAHAVLDRIGALLSRD